IVVNFQDAVDTRIDEINRASLVVDKVFAYLAILWFGVLPDAIGCGVGLCVLSADVFGLILAVLTEKLVFAEHEVCFGRISSNLLIIGPRAIKEDQKGAEHECRTECSDEDRDLLTPWRTANPESCFEVLRCSTAIRRSDTDDAADRERRNEVRVGSCPAESQEYETGDQERCDRHPGDRVRGRTDLARQSR